jgi:GTP-binding protein
VSTSEVNRVILGAVERNSPPVRFNRTPRIYYATQVGCNPPTIVVFTNGPDLFDEPYRRYLLKCLREQLPFAEVPIRLQLRLRGSGQPRSGQAEEAPAAETPQPERVKPVRKAKPRRPKTKPHVWRNL